MFSCFSSDSIFTSVYNCFPLFYKCLQLFLHCFTSFFCLFLFGWHKWLLLWQYSGRRIVNHKSVYNCLSTVVITSFLQTFTTVFQVFTTVFKVIQFFTSVYNCFSLFYKCLQLFLHCFTRFFCLFLAVINVCCSDNALREES